MKIAMTVGLKNENEIPSSMPTAASSCECPFQVSISFPSSFQFSGHKKSIELPPWIIYTEKKLGCVWLPVVAKKTSLLPYK